MTFLSRAGSPPKKKKRLPPSHHSQLLRVYQAKGNNDGTCRTDRRSLRFVGTTDRACGRIGWDGRMHAKESFSICQSTRIASGELGSSANPRHFAPAHIREPGMTTTTMDDLATCGVESRGARHDVKIQDLIARMRGIRALSQS